MPGNKLFHGCIRWVYNNLFPKGIRNSLKTALLLTEHDCHTSQISAFNEKKILVIAPHMDDEAIGCGGTLVLHSINGAKITIAFMTNGALGDERLLDTKLSKDEFHKIQNSLVQTRRNEAQNCANKLGAENLMFFNGKDGSLKPSSTLINQLTEVIINESPDIIYLPFLMDFHEDHWQTNCLFYECLKNIPDPLYHSVICRCYEVWSPLVANRLVDISSVISLKIDALSEYKSQLNDVDYVHCIKGLNRYRAIKLKAGIGYCEAFFECNLTEYRELIKRVVSKALP